MLPNYRLFGFLSLYNLFLGLGVAALLLFLAFISKKYGMPRWKAFVAGVLLYAVGYVLMKVLYWVSTGFKSFGAGSSVRIYVWIPLFIWLFSKPLKYRWQDMCDMIGPGFIVSMFVMRFGCIFAGCCHGYPTDSWIGIYNAVVNGYVFPVQIFEILTLLLIAVVLISRMIRQRYQTKGELYPLMLILYGSTRFFWEFFRDNRKILLQISGMAFHALFACLVGIAWYLSVRERNKATNSGRHNHK